LYYQDNNFGSSRLVLEKVVSLNENYANARYFLGLTYDKLGEKDKALEQFKIIARANPDNQEIQKIITNLEKGKAALSNIVPPAVAPEKRENPPLSDEENQLNKKK
jgi:tetratricopeptide (TPR) repeat protein